ncbi:hypothetical protein HZS_2544 [Henneguya salminicola]|nr:hypothetical protein HZS_2544 [Henneguya salminicola]
MNVDNINQNYMNKNFFITINDGRIIKGILAGMDRGGDMLMSDCFEYTNPNEPNGTQLPRFLKLVYIKYEYINWTIPENGQRGNPLMIPRPWMEEAN